MCHSLFFVLSWSHHDHTLMINPIQIKQKNEGLFLSRVIPIIHGIPAISYLIIIRYPLQPARFCPITTKRSTQQQPFKNKHKWFSFNFYELFEPSHAHPRCTPEGWGHARTRSRFRYARSDDRERRAGTGCARTIRHPRTSARTEEEVVDGFRGVVAREGETTGWIRRVKGVNGGAHATHGIFNVSLVLRGGRRHGEQSKSTCYLGYWTLSPSLSLSLSTPTLTKPRIKRFGGVSALPQDVDPVEWWGKVIGFEGNGEIGHSDSETYEGKVVEERGRFPLIRAPSFYAPSLDG